jgi:hypothetical protein
VVLLGGAGRIGQALKDRLSRDGIATTVLDHALPGPPATLKSSGISALVVDVSRVGAIDRYIDELPEGTVILNEVFPEPSREVLAEIKNRHFATYHIAGVPANVYPSLPLGYRNALPCCAIHCGEVGDPILERIA